MNERIFVGLALAGVLLSGCQASGSSDAQAAAASSPAPVASPDTVIVKTTAPTLIVGSSTSTSASATISAGGDVSVTGPTTIHNNGGTMTITTGPGGSFSTSGSDSHGSDSDSGSSMIQNSSGGPMLTTELSGSAASAGAHGLKVQSDFGDIKFVRASTDGQMDVKVTISVNPDQLSPSLRKTLLSGFKLKIDNEGGIARVSVVAPSDMPAHVGFGAAYQIAVPSGLSLDARTSNGAVDVADVGAGGKLTLNSDFGAITVHNSGDSIVAKTSNGAITISDDGSLESVSAHSDFGAVDVTSAARSVDAKSRNGAVTVKGAVHASSVSAHSDFGAVTVENCGGRIDAGSSNGQVAFSADSAVVTQLTCKSDFGAVRASLGDCGRLAGADLATSNGAVSVLMPRSASVRVHAHTSNGSIDRDGFDGAVSGDSFDKSFIGSLNGGRANIEATSDFGSVTVSAH